MIKIVGPLILAALVLTACVSVPRAPNSAVATQAAPVAAEKTVFVVRHLQRGPGEDDPSLTAEGAANAQRLADMLADKGIVAVFATATKRAMQTAQPLAARLGIAVTSYDPKDPGALATAVAAAPGPVLVVGHSNTVPDLVKRFGGAEPAPLGTDDYGTLFVVDPGGEVATLEVR